MKSEISTLLDGELEPGKAGRAIDFLQRDASLRQDWETYQLIGDALRRSPMLSADFSDRVLERLAREPHILSPATMPAQSRKALRFALPVAASVVGVGVVGWLALSLNEPGPVQMAKVQKPPVEAAAPPVAVRPAEGALKEYLVAHQAQSPSGRMQGVAPYVRTVSEIRQGSR
jgi:sigma-E factor negative regulatory protein RseA